ncbi:MAG: trypsin-like peptidase domain-containing protein [Cyanobacteria bacterium P01_C01_bin.89]
MSRRPLSLLVAIALTLGTSTVQQIAVRADDDAPVPRIDLPFNDDTDGNAFIPPDRETSDRPFDSDRVIIGNDDRVPVTTRRFPWSAIGRVDLLDHTGRKINHCTGTLIGPSLVLTNAHCITYGDTGSPKAAAWRFRPALISGRSIVSARVTDFQVGARRWGQALHADWALLELDRPLGETYGYMGWRNLDFEQDNFREAIAGKVRMVGYSGDFPEDEPGQTAGVHENCSILDTFREELIHNCDTNGGASGGPIFGFFEDGKPYIVGLHSAGRSTADGRGIENLAVSVDRWATAAKEMQ